MKPIITLAMPLLVVAMPALAQDSEPSQLSLSDECARAAAHTLFDKRGIAFDELDPATAIPLCEKAMAADPSDENSDANLARALIKAERYEEAFSRLRKLAEARNYQAINNLGLFYQEGRGGEVRLDLAEDVFRLAYSEFAEHWMADRLADVLWRQEDDPDKQAEAVTLYKIAAEGGQTSAFWDVGNAYALGRGVPQDQAEATAWLMRGANAGHRLSMETLGVRARDGIEGPSDFESAEYWFRLSSQDKGEELEVRVATFLFQGEGGAANPEPGVTRLHKLATQDNVRALKVLKVFSEIGLRMEKDLAASHRYALQLAQLGDVEGQVWVANNFRVGTGVGQDIDESLRWFIKAAENDSPQALYQLGFTYLQGRFVTRDVQRARDYLNRAIDAGSTRAMHALALHLAQEEDESEADRVVDLLIRAADDGELASTMVLAWPSDEMPNRLRSEFDNAPYRERLDDLAPKTRAAIAHYFMNSRGIQQSIAHLFEFLDAPVSELGFVLDPSREFELIDLALYEPAIDLFLKMVTSPEFAAMDSEIRQRYVAEFDARMASKCGWVRIPSIPLRKFERLYEVGVTGAATQLAFHYYNGSGGLPLDYDLANLWADRAAEHGSASAMRLIGAMYEQARGRESDKELARRWFLAGAENGDRHAAASLSYMFREGIGGAKDYAAARHWAEQSARDDFARGLFQLGWTEYLGVGVEENRAKAESAWRRSAMAGYEPAATQIGYEYLKGSFGKKSDAEAERWLRLSLRQGHENAAHILIQMIVAGRADEDALPQIVNVLDEGFSNGSYWSAGYLARIFGSPSSSLYGVRDITPYVDFILRGWDEAIASPEQDHARLRNIVPLMLVLKILGIGMERDFEGAIKLVEQIEDVNPNYEPELRALALIFKESDTPKVRQQVAELLAKVDFWATQEVAELCRNAQSLSCYRSQPDILKLLGIGVAGNNALTRDLRPEIAAVEATIAEAVHLNGEVLAAYKRLEFLYDLNGDSGSVVATRLRKLLHDEATILDLGGSIADYNNLLSQSCRWGNASKLAYTHGHKEEAIFFAKTAVNRLQAARRMLSALDAELQECFLDMHSDRYRWLADLFIEFGRLPEAEYVLSMLKDYEFRAYTSRSDAVGISLDEFPLTPKETLAQQSLEKVRNRLARAAQSERATREARRSSELGEDQKQVAREARAVFNATNDQFRADLSNILDALMQPGVERDLRSISVSEAQALPSMMNFLARSFSDREVATLHAVVVPDRLLWIISTPNYQRTVSVDIDRIKLMQNVFKFRNYLQDPESDPVPMAQKLFEQIFTEVDEELKVAGVKRVMMSLDSVLRYIPMAALHDGKDWLVSRYEFSQFQQANSTSLTIQPFNDWSVAGFGLTQAIGGFDPLPGVDVELASIVNDDKSTGIIPGISRLDEDFTRAALSDALFEEYRVVHIATHFKLSPLSPGDSFLVLGDGSRLSLEDIRMGGEFSFPNVDLLTLSACETGFFDGQYNGSELDGLAAQVQNAGAPAVLASLWKVSDATTPYIMRGFYEVRAGQQSSKPGALRSAQLRFLTAARGKSELAGFPPKRDESQANDPPPNYEHPFFWAPFVLIGNVY